MNNIPIDMLDKTFGRVKLHQNIGKIIKEYSTSQTPLNKIVYNGLSYPEKIKVVDIGCGYGRCITYLYGIVHSGSEYVGIDPLESNRLPFLNGTEAANYNGNFICGTAEKIAKFPKEYFDLILCNFSLYFFIDTLPLIVNKLKSDGLFITITHSNSSLDELLDDLQIVLNIDHKPTWDELGSEQVLDNFNGENGYELLKPHFDNIEKIDYPNNLKFYLKDIDRLFELLNFKKTTLIHHNDFAKYIRSNEFDSKLRDTITSKTQKMGKYILNKNDTIFRCRKPIHKYNYEKVKS